MSNWQYLPPVSQPGMPVSGEGMPITFRDPLDARRAMQGRVPSAEYPDGYLGTINSRREDRLLNQLKVRLNQRSYQRGVHKGERTDAADYFWPPELDPATAGVLRQARTGLRAAPLMTVGEQVTAGRVPRGAGALRTAPISVRQLGPSWK